MNVAYSYMLDQEHNKAPRVRRNRYFHYLLGLNEKGEIISGGGGISAEILPNVVAADENDEVIGSVSPTGNAQESTAVPAAARDMLERLFTNVEDEGGANEDGEGKEE